MNIQVLWVDDEYKEDFVSFAEQEGIDIHHLKSAQEGKEELERNHQSYHAVILDAKGILNKDDQKTGLDGLRTIRDYLKELNANNYLPHFIFTGQPDYQTNALFRESFGEFFTKGRDEQLILDKIKDAVLKKDEYVIQKVHRRVFEGVKNLLDDELHAYLTDLLISLNKQFNNIDDKLHFTQLRIILEHLFRAANKSGLLHDKCIVGGKVNLTESSFFLAGEDTKYAGVKNNIPHFPRLIANAVKDILFITGAASHSPDPEIGKNINLQEYRSQIGTPYLLYSLTFRMLDVIVWFDDYIKMNSDYSNNVAQWREFDTGIYAGKIEQDKDGDYHCGDVMLNNKYVSHRFAVGTKILITEISENTSNTKSKYPKFGSKFTKLDE